MISSNNLTKSRQRRFQRLVLLTISVIYLVILAGGIVRSTGSGMGCPDWPKCFGRWVPPTTADQLPADYQRIYGAKLKGEVEFNATKTWIEYVNRLLGVLSGLFVFATLIGSIPYLKKDRLVFWGSLSALLLIGANGWLGSRVVATELADYMITLHMLLAILVAFSLLIVYVRLTVPAGTIIDSPGGVKQVRYAVFAAIFLSFVQIVLGTQVRDSLDQIVREIGFDQRDQWVSNLDWSFYVHRSFSLVILAVNAFIVSRLWRKAGQFRQLAGALLAGIGLEIATGIVMAYLAVPAVAQPIHLLLALLIIGVQFVVWLILSPRFSRAETPRVQPSLSTV